MNLAECRPGIQGPQREISLVQDAVKGVAIARLGFDSVAELVGSRAYRGSYISFDAYKNCAIEICKHFQGKERINRTLGILEMYPALDRSAHQNDLCSNDLTKLVELPEYIDYAEVLLPILLAGIASDWDVLIPETKKRFRINVEETGSCVEFHPPKK